MMTSNLFTIFKERTLTSLQKQEAQENLFYTLPNELLEEIFNKLDLSSLKNLAEASYHLHVFARSNKKRYLRLLINAIIQKILYTLDPLNQNNRLLKKCNKITVLLNEKSLSHIFFTKKLPPVLPNFLFTQLQITASLDHALQLTDSENKERAFVDVIKNQVLINMDEALKIRDLIKDSYQLDRAHSFISKAEANHNIFNALTIAQLIDNETIKDASLYEIIKICSPLFAIEALNIAFLIINFEIQLKAFSIIGRYLKIADLENALYLIHNVKDPSQKNRILFKIIKTLSPLYPAEVLNAINSIQFSDVKIVALIKEAKILAIAYQKLNSIRACRQLLMDLNSIL